MSDTAPAQPPAPTGAPPAPASPPPAQPPANPPTPPADPPAAEETDWKAEARKWETRAKDNSDAAARLKEIEDAQRTEEERLKHELDQAKATSTESVTGLLQLQVALDKAPAGMDAAKVRKLAERLRGSTREEMEADAAELFADFVASPAPPAAGGQQTPVENLKPGALPTQGEPSLPEQIAEAEKAGDWGLARSLKSQQLVQLHKGNTPNTN